MAGGRAGAALRDRLGEDATSELVELLESKGTDWSEQVLSVAADRFERRMAGEVATLRVDMAREFTAVRREMHEALAVIKSEMHEGFTAVRSEMHAGNTSIRGEIHAAVTALRQEITTVRVEWLRWSFVFWIGQVAAIAALLSFMLKR